MMVLSFVSGTILLENSITMSLKVILSDWYGSMMSKNWLISCSSFYLYMKLCESSKDTFWILMLILW